jgi:hypothetical protein
MSAPTSLGGRLLAAGFSRDEATALVLNEIARRYGARTDPAPRTHSVSTPAGGATAPDGNGTQVLCGEQVITVTTTGGSMQDACTTTTRTTTASAGEPRREGVDDLAGATAGGPEATGVAPDRIQTVSAVTGSAGGQAPAPAPAPLDVAGLDAIRQRWDGRGPWEAFDELVGVTEAGVPWLRVATCESADDAAAIAAAPSDVAALLQHAAWQATALAELRALVDRLHADLRADRRPARGGAEGGR